MIEKSINETVTNIADMLEQEITAITNIYRLLLKVAGDNGKD